jgi:hypothetical protein
MFPPFWFHFPTLTNSAFFQISIPPDQVVAVAKCLSQRPVRLTGFGVKDSLRLEAGMCWYGNDLDEGTTPVEAGLGWVIGKSKNHTLFVVSLLLIPDPAHRKISEKVWRIHRSGGCASTAPAGTTEETGWIPR